MWPPSKSLSGKRRAMALAAKHMRRKREQEEKEEIARFQRFWECCYGKYFGSFEETTVVPSMCYTFGSVPKYANPDEGLQIFSVKVAQLKEEEGLHWPLHVYGFIAIRDSIDPRRNHLFHRTRDNCQIITEEDPFLLLTGPSRAAVLIDPISFEVQLKAKGKTKSEDKVLVFDVLTSQHAVVYLGDPPPIFTSYLQGKRSKLDFTFALLAESVEATICVEVVHGSWPEQIPGRVTARMASIDHEHIVLVDSGDGRLPIGRSGAIKLSRQVVSVELSGELKVDVMAYFGEAVKGSAVFTPKKARISYKSIDLSFCKLGVTVGWSLFSPLVPEQSSCAV
uniref:DUF6598 domain-containing protein n=1 Tax=Arundo donax TaxID=35708 RepID=A0A0A9CIW4_ARUDO